jgi:hypothetical protein
MLNIKYYLTYYSNMLVQAEIRQELVHQDPFGGVHTIAMEADQVPMLDARYELHLRHELAFRPFRSYTKVEFLDCNSFSIAERSL